MDESAERARFLTAYDEQLRTDAETPGAVEVVHHGPLRLVTFLHGRGFVTHQNLEPAGPHAIRQLVAEAVAYYEADPAIRRVEWKTRGHDHAPGLYEALLGNGFRSDETESIMIGNASALCVDVPLPDGVTLRRVVEEQDVRAMSAMQDEVFGDPISSDMADALLRRLSLNDDGMAPLTVLPTGSAGPASGPPPAASRSAWPSTRQRTQPR